MAAAAAEVLGVMRERHNPNLNLVSVSAWPRMAKKRSSRDVLNCQSLMQFVDGKDGQSSGQRECSSSGEYLAAIAKLDGMSAYLDLASLHLKLATAARARMKFMGPQSIVNCIWGSGNTVGIGTRTAFYCLAAKLV